MRVDSGVSPGPEIEQIYDAVLDDSALRGLPRMLAQAIGAKSCLISHGSGKSGFELLTFNTFGPDLQTQYDRHFAEHDTWLQLGMINARGQARSFDRYLSKDAWHRTTIYNDFLRANGLGDIAHCLGLVICSEDGRELGICGIQRDLRQGSFVEHDERRLQQLVPHLERLLLLRERLDKVERHAQSVERMFDHLTLGAALVSADGNVHYCNAAAGDLLRRSDGLTYSFAHHIGAELKSDGVMLRALISRAARARSGGATLVRRGSGALPFQVLVSPFAPPWPAHRDLALVIIHDPSREPVDLAATLMQLFGLSAGEARVAVLLAEGKSLGEIAEGSGVKLSTVQTQLKRALEKTGQRRQSSLIKLASRVPQIRSLRPAE